jgi:hypothetical protein
VAAVLALCLIGGARVGSSAGVQRSPAPASRHAAPVPPLLYTESDTDRGCCVLSTQPAKKCVFTNRGYCRSKAQEAGVAFELLLGTSCAEVPACPVE